MKIFKITITALFIIFFLGVLGPVSAQSADEVKIIAHKDIKIDTVAAEFISKLYLGKTKKWADGTKAVPVILKDDKAHPEFLGTYVKKSVSKFANHWKKLIFTGRGIPPKEFKEAEKVVEYIKNHPGSIGYIAGNVDISAVKVIKVN